jgi:acyl carrier protein
MKKSELKKIVAEILEISDESFPSDVNLGEVSNFDSVAILTLMVGLDEQTGIKMSASDAKSLQCFSDIEKMAVRDGISLED